MAAAIQRAETAFPLPAVAVMYMVFGLIFPGEMVRKCLLQIWKRDALLWFFGSGKAGNDLAEINCVLGTLRRLRH